MSLATEQKLQAQGKYIATKSGVSGLSPKALLIRKEEGTTRSRRALTFTLSVIPLSLCMNSVVDLAFSDNCCRFCDNSVWKEN